MIISTTLHYMYVYLVCIVCTSKCGSPAAEVLACDGSHSGDVISAVFVCPFLSFVSVFAVLYS